MAYKVFSNGNALNASELNTYLMNQSVISFATATARDAALTSPTEGTPIVWLEDSNKHVYYTGSAWADLITPASSGNAIINGAFDIWQRGTSFSNPSTNSFTADRYYIVHDGSGATRTISQQTFTPGTAPVAGYEGQFFYRYNQSVAGSGGTYASIVHKVEDVRTYAGQTVTFSFWAKADSARTVGVYWTQMFGSGGSSQVDVNFGNASVTTSWTRFTLTAALPALTGKTVGTGSNLQLQFVLPINTTQTIDIWGLQLEAGSTATAFKRNASNIQSELAACQRYYQDSSGGTGTLDTVYGGTSSGGFTGNAYANCLFPVQMRVAPTLTFYAHDGSSGQVTLYNGGSAVKSTSVAGMAALVWGFNGNFAGTSWGSNADSGMLAYSYKAEAEV